MKDSKEKLQPLNNPVDPERIYEIVDLFKKVQRNFRKKIYERFKRSGLTVPQVAAILQLMETPAITLNELSDYLQVSKSTASGIVERLVNQNIIVREVPRENRRIVRLSISKDFLCSNDFFALKQDFYDSLKNASSDDIEFVIAGLKRLDTLLENATHLNE